MKGSPNLGAALRTYASPLLGSVEQLETKVQKGGLTEEGAMVVLRDAPKQTAVRKGKMVVNILVQHVLVSEVSGGNCRNKVGLNVHLFSPSRLVTGFVVAPLFPWAYKYH